MPTCANCGRALQPGAQVCSGCGVQVPPRWEPPTPPQWAPPTAQQLWAPPPQAPQQAQQWTPPPQQQMLLEPEPRAAHPARGPILVIAGAVLLVVAAVAAFVVFRHVSGGSPSAAAAALPTTTVQNPGPATTTTTVPTTTSTTDTTTAPATPTDEASAQQALQQLVDSDRTSVEALVGSWVPQLSSKKVGLVVNGVTFDYLAILADYQQEAAAHPGALLLKSDDYSNFLLTGFWVTVAPQQFGDPGSANSWCDSQNIDANDCFAERLTHTGDAQGNTVYRH